MKLIGKVLKEVRIKKKYRIPEIASELKISSKNLTDIENDDFYKDVDSVYLMGHIRSYAKYLELDDNEIIKNFKIQISYNYSYPSNEISKPIISNKLSLFPQTFSIISVVVIAISFYFLFVVPNDNERQYAMTPNLPENLSSDLEEIEMNLTLSKQSNKSTLKELNVENENFFLKDIVIKKKPNLSSAIASLPKKESIQFDNQITLKFINSTWVQLRNDKNDIIISKLMNKGDEYSYFLNDNFNLTAGNAGNIIVLLNNEVKGKAGKAGEVIDSLIIDKNFNN